MARFTHFSPVLDVSWAFSIYNVSCIDSVYFALFRESSTEGRANCSQASAFSLPTWLRTHFRKTIRYTPPSYNAYDSSCNFYSARNRTHNIQIRKTERYPFTPEGHKHLFLMHLHLYLDHIVIKYSTTILTFYQHQKHIIVLAP